MGTYANLLQKNTKPAQDEPKKQSVETEQPNERPVERANDAAAGYTGERPAKIRRAKVRHSFEFYQDQVEALKDMQRTAVLHNENFSMSAVVREALDQYLNRRKR